MAADVHGPQCECLAEAGHGRPQDAQKEPITLRRCCVDNSSTSSGASPSGGCHCLLEPDLTERRFGPESDNTRAPRTASAPRHSQMRRRRP
jgi:hypothetical protein